MPTLAPGYTSGAGGGGLGDQAPSLTHLYSGVGLRAADRLAAFLLANAVSPSAPWFTFRTGEDRLDERRDVATYLRHAQQAVSRALRPSFYTAVHRAFLELTVNYGVLHSFEDPEAGSSRILFEHVPSASVFYRLDMRGEVEAVARTMSLRDEQFEALGGEGRAKGAVAGAHHEVVHLIERTTKGFVGTWLDMARSKVLKTARYSTCPYHIFEWQRLPGSSYSVGPVYAALPEIRGANALRRQAMQINERIANPPILAPNKTAVPRGLKLRPGALLYGGMNADGRALYGLMQTAGNPAGLLNDLADSEERARDALYSSELMVNRRPNMTATEVLSVESEKAIMSVPFTVGLTRTLSGIVQRTLGLLEAQGKVPAAPAALANEAAEPRMIGQLEQAVRRVRAAGMQGFLGQISGLTALDPGLMERINTDVLVADLADAYDVDPKILQPSHNSVRADI